MPAEPKELKRILLPRIEDIHAYLAKAETTPQTVDGSGVGIRCGAGEARIPQ